MRTEFKIYSGIHTIGGVVFFIKYCKYIFLIVICFGDDKNKYIYFLYHLL